MPENLVVSCDAEAIANTLAAALEAVCPDHFPLLPPPDEATTEVPLEALEALHQARCKLEDTAAQANGMVFASRRKDVVAAVQELADVWGEREAQANREGRLTMPAGTLAEMRSSGVL